MLHAYRAHRYKKTRGADTRRALAGLVDQLEPEEIERALRIILHLDSSLAWKTLTEEGLTTDEASRAVVWAIRALVGELTRMNRERSAESKPD